MVDSCWGECRTPKCLRIALIRDLQPPPPLPVVQGHTGCFYEMRDEMCLSLHLQLSGFTPSSATKVSQHPEPHALYCWQEQWGLKINWWAALSNFSHISVETSFCQLQLWLPRQKEQRIRQLLASLHERFNCLTASFSLLHLVNIHLLKVMLH